MALASTHIRNHTAKPELMEGYMPKKSTQEIFSIETNMPRSKCSTCFITAITNNKMRFPLHLVIPSQALDTGAVSRLETLVQICCNMAVAKSAMTCYSNS